ncbi:MAG: ferritin-like domain-containing protein [Candidatus Zipacnadales bacterium]
MPKTREQFINTAIQFEQEGREFYLEAARTTGSGLARAVFESLAQDELRHIDWLKTLSTGGVTAEGEIEALAQRLWPVFQALDPETVAKATTDDVAALNLGIEREDASIRAYEEAAGSQGDELHDLCTLLANVEKTHRRLLENVVEYLEYPDQFFLREERWIVEG